MTDTLSLLRFYCELHIWDCLIPSVCPRLFCFLFIDSVSFSLLFVATLSMIRFLYVCRMCLFLFELSKPLTFHRNIKSENFSSYAEHLGVFVRIRACAAVVFHLMCMKFFFNGQTWQNDKVIEIIFVFFFISSNSDLKLR